MGGPSREACANHSTAEREWCRTSDAIRARRGVRSSVRDELFRNGPNACIRAGAPRVLEAPEMTERRLAGRCGRKILGLSFAVVLGLTTWGWSLGPASAEDAPPPPLAPFLERAVPGLTEERAKLPPFLRDADLTHHLRTYHLNRTKPDDSVNEALAFGGWIGIKSGWLLDTFAMGATLYGSAPLYAPDDRDGTTLLKTGQKGYYAPGEAWGALRYKDYA